MKLLSAPKFLTLRLAAYFLMALLLRLALLDRFPALLTGDSSGYLVASYHIQQAADFAYTSRQAVMLPGYPAFLAVVALLTDISSVSIVALQKMIGLLGLPLGYGIGRLLHSRLLGELLVLFLAFNPIFLFFEHVLGSETLFIFLLLLLTFGWLWWLRRRPTPLTGGLVGLLLGLTILTRANSLAYGLVLISGGFISLMAGSKARGWQDKLKGALPALLPLTVGLLLLLAPWLGLNYTVHQRVGLLNFNNRNLLLYKALHNPLDQTLPELAAVNESLGTPFGNDWLYRLKQNYAPGEAEAMARSLYLEQVLANPGQHIRQIGASLNNYFGRYHRIGNELATVYFWFERLLPNVESVEQLARDVMYDDHPDFVYVPVAAQTDLNRAWSRVGLLYLTVLRPLLALLAGLALALVLVRRYWRRVPLPPSFTPLLIIALGYAATAGTHILTLTTNDRYAVPFDWLLFLSLAGSALLLLSPAGQSAAPEGE